MKRHTDGQTAREDFARLFLVHCPHCQGAARVTTRMRDNGDETVVYPSHRPALHQPPMWKQCVRRMTCSSCGHSDESALQGPPKDSVSRDWYYERPLFLQIACCRGQVLSVYNLEHLDWLEDFVSSAVREGPRGHHSMAARLPKWIQTPRNRAEILRAAAKLRERATEAGIAS